MRPTLRNIIIVVLIAAIVVTFHIVRRNATMRGLECSVSTDGAATLLSPNDVDSLILSGFPNLLTTDIKDLDKKAVVHYLQQHPYVDEAIAHITTGGKMTVQVRQHKPVVRMFYQGNEFYISRKGTCLPLSEKHYCHLLVGNSQGKEPRLLHPTALNLSDTANHHQPLSLMKIWALASFLHDNPKYGNIFDQVFIDSTGDLILVPKLGDLTVNIGDTSLLVQKFNNLWSFFDQGISRVGWDTYSSISLKYRGQVVCTKRQ